MKHKKEFYSIIIRYSALLLASLSNLWIFYFVFTPLTIYPVYFLLDWLFEAYLYGNIVIVNEKFPIEMIPACIAGSAYYLLFVLNLSTPNIKIKKRLKMILLSFVTLLVINIMRIFFLSVIFVEGFPGFIIAHKLFWYFMSTLFVVGIWFMEIKIFRIREVPFYSDIKFLFKNSKFMK